MNVIHKMYYLLINHEHNVYGESFLGECYRINRRTVRFQ
jgi:hypothetical protein